MSRADPAAPSQAPTAEGPAERSPPPQLPQAKQKAASRTLGRVQAFRERHATAELAGFLLAGFLFDVFTLTRIDDLLTLVMQGGYLTLLGMLLLLDQRRELCGDLPRLVMGALRFSEEAVHFLLGSLLSMFALFYFRSASGLASLGFLALIFGFLVINELPRFRKLGPVVRFGLFSFALTSYFAYLLPVVAGFLSPWLFYCACVLSAFCTYLLFRWVRGWGERSRRVALRRVLLPAMLVQGALVGLFLARAIPPVPLSVQEIGVYHRVERTPEGYQLEHERAGWRFWHRGDQRFLSRPGDRVYVFTRIFAPSKFQDRVYLRWQQRDARGWGTTDRIPLRISGGRTEGYRGFAFKEYYKPGRWRVDVETEDGRVIGRIHFEIEPDPRLEGLADPAEAPERAFQVESA